MGCDVVRWGFPVYAEWQGVEIVLVPVDEVAASLIPGRQAELVLEESSLDSVS